MQDTMYRYSYQVQACRCGRTCDAGAELPCGGRVRDTPSPRMRIEPEFGIRRMEPSWSMVENDQKHTKNKF